MVALLSLRRQYLTMRHSQFKCWRSKKKTLCTHQIALWQCLGNCNIPFLF